jgi:hypothetical protein
MFHICFQKINIYIQMKYKKLLILEIIQILKELGIMTIKVKILHSHIPEAMHLMKDLQKLEEEDIQILKIHINKVVFIPMLK